MPDPDMVKLKAVAKAGAEGFGGGLLGGKPTRQEMGGPVGPGEFRQLSIAEDAACEPVAEPPENRLYARYLDDVGTDAVDQRLRASTINRFISRTAVCMPQNNARAMIA